MAIADPVGFILGTGVGPQLAIGVLGVLAITSEYSSGVIRARCWPSCFILPMLAAKAVVFAVLLIVVTEIVASLLVLRRLGHPARPQFRCR